MIKKITVNDKMQTNYIYYLKEPIGENFAYDFDPHLTPKEMLKIGVFGGKYMTDCQDEFPDDWFENAKLAKGKTDPKLNFFGIKASMSLNYRQEKGWIYKDDPRGWFQRYCRYYMGRRIENEDARQIKRWKAFKRHRGAVRNNCHPMDRDCRKKQRQALLHWAYDSRKI